MRTLSQIILSMSTSYSVVSVHMSVPTTSFSFLLSWEYHSPFVAMLTGLPDADQAQECGKEQRHHGLHGELP